VDEQAGHGLCVQFRAPTGAEAGNRRLHRARQQLGARGKRSTISAVAGARELAGWTWSLAVMDD
jgi:hypothetical protein